MDFLKKNNWWLCLLANIITCGLFYIFLAKFMKLFDKDAWYMNKWYWILGGLCLVFPIVIMLFIFALQMNCKVAKELKVSGCNIYNTPYTWIAFFIIPIVGWALFIVMMLYVFVIPHIKLAQGSGEKYIK